MNVPRLRLPRPAVLALAGLTIMAWPQTLKPQAPEGAFTREFFLEECTFSSTGSNPYFVLEPGYRLLLAGEEDGEEVVLSITVLDETLQIGGVETRVVRERELSDGEVVEISRNYFAICKETNSVVYFGENVNIYEDGEVVSHAGAWRHGVHGARAGLIMPGTLLLGARYFQEVAPPVALDRAEILGLNEIITTPLGQFTNCLMTRETTPVEPGVEEFKFYAPGVGLIKEKTLRLVDAGFLSASELAAENKDVN